MHQPVTPTIFRCTACLSAPRQTLHGPHTTPSSLLQHGPSKMLRAVKAVLPCSCLPNYKQADKKSPQSVSYELTNRQPSPTQYPTINKQKEEEEDHRQTQEQEPAQETVPVLPPTEDDSDSTLSAIEASIDPNHEDDNRDGQNNEEQTKLDRFPKRASAPPNLELNLSYDPLPDFSLNSHSRLSYWGPPPHLAPNHPLPAPLIRLRQLRGSHIYENPLYSAYFRGE